MRDRFAASESDLLRAVNCIGSDLIEQIALGRHIELFKPHDGCSVTLGVNDVNPQEGIWCIALRGETGERQFSLSFAFLAGAAVLIGSVQGAYTEGEGTGFAKSFTKLSHGLRPPTFLVEVLRAMCAGWGIGVMLGIDPLYHVKGRWNQRRRRLKFDYRQLWREHDAVEDERGYWAMNTFASARSLADVPSKKRSMYRRRFAMLEEMRLSVEATLAAQDKRSISGIASAPSPWRLAA